MNEREAMELCMELALNGWGRVHPNPMVGAVLLREGHVVGSGYHGEYGGPHAEIVALDSVEDASGCTCVVNLEPCDHHGKTPPCTAALIAARVKRVVYGCRDPHDEARGGCERLRDSGIEVEYLDTNGVAESFNSSFLYQLAEPDLPYVVLKLATTMDGFIADTAGNSKWISGPEARDFVQWLRAGFEGIGVGRATFEIDDPQLTVRGSVKPRVNPVRVIFTRTGKLEVGLRLFTSAAEVPTFVVGVGANVALGQSVPGVTFLRGDTLEEALKELKRVGCRSLLVEGGGELAGALLDAGLVRRFYWVQAPILLRDGVPAFARGPGLDIGSADQWKMVETRRLGEDTLVVLEKGLCLPELS